jgi:hypothetical protein
MVLVVIELIHPPESAAADAIAEELREMVVAFRQVEDPEMAAPVLRDGDRVATTEEQIAGFMSELRRDLALWSKFQSDACYVDKNGRIC